MTEHINLTTHERHARLVKIVRKTWQAEHDGARLFPNVSGIAWQGNALAGVAEVTLINPRPVFFGIPEPSRGKAEKKSGGADLIGWTICQFFPPDKTKSIIPVPATVFTAIECKSGKAILMKNQRVFRDNLKKAGGIYYVARECPECWDNWTPVMAGGKVVEWKIGACPCCDGRGYILEE
jgi:hypothetical protein